MKIKAALCALLALGLAGTAFAGGDAEAGKALAEACADCHEAADLALGHDDFVAAMKAFREGEGDEMMAMMAADLSDEDIANLAAYYSGK